jgi:hypothetical protein
MDISAEMVAQVLTAAGNIAVENESYREAENLYGDALIYVEQAYGPKSHQAATLYRWLAEVAILQGKTAESVLLMKRVDDINRAYRKANSEPGIMDLLCSL